MKAWITLYAVSETNQNYLVFVTDLCFQDACSTDDLWSLFENGFAITSNLSSNTSSEFYLNELESESFSTHLHQLCSKVFIVDHSLTAEAMRRLSWAGNAFNRFSFPKNQIHGINHFSPSAWAAIMVCIILMFLAVLGTMAELYGLNVRQKTSGAKGQKDSKD